MRDCPFEAAQAVHVVNWPWDVDPRRLEHLPWGVGQLKRKGNATFRLLHLQPTQIIGL